MKICERVLSSGPADMAWTFFMAFLWIIVINLITVSQSSAQTGTPEDDVIANTGIVNDINGLAGNDTITNRGTVTNDINGGSGDDTITNSGAVNGFIFGTINRGSGSRGGHNMINNSGDVYMDIIGSSNEGDSSSGGSNIIINSGYVDWAISGSDNIGNNSDGGENVINNSGIVIDGIFGSWNVGDGSSGGSNSIDNSGIVLLGIAGSLNGGAGSNGGRNTITNPGTVFSDIYGSLNGGTGSSGGSNAIINSGIVYGDIFGSDNIGIGSSGGSNMIRNSGEPGHILGSANEGDYSSGGGNRITNSGIVHFDIIGSWNGGDYSSGGDNTIINTGTVLGGICGSVNQGVGSSGGGNRIVNAGTVTGDICGSENGPGTGSDNTLELVGPSHVGGNIYSFTRFLKTGEGTATVGGNISFTGLDQARIQGWAGSYPAIFANTATLDGDLEPYGYFPTGTVVLIRTNGLAGGFSSLIDNSEVLDFIITNNGNNVELTTTRRSYRDVLSGLTEPERSIAEILSDEAHRASGDLAFVIGVIDFLTLAGIESALEQLWPTTLSGMNRIGHMNAGIFVDNIVNRLKVLRINLQSGTSRFSSGNTRVFLASLDGPTGLGLSNDGSNLNGFDQMIIHGGHQDESSEQIGYHYNTLGNIAGADRMVGNNIHGGFNLGYFKSDIDYRDKGRSNGQVDTVSAGVYGTRLFEQLHLDGALYGGYNWYDSKRRIDFGAVERTAEANFGGWVLGTHIGAGYDFSSGGFLITPEASLDYAYLTTQSYLEKGAGDLNLHVDDTSTHFLSTTLGLNAAYNYETTGDLVVIPSMYVGWRHEFFGNDENIRTYLVGADSDPFYIDTAEPDRDSALIGLSLQMTLDRLSFIAKFDSRMSSDLNTHQFSAKFQYLF